MIRKTSIDVFRQIEAEGLLSRLRFDVYRELFKHGPCSALELYKKCFAQTHRDHSITPRFSELEKAGVIETMGERECLVSGRRVLVWDVTDKLPLKFDKPEKRTCPTCKGKGVLIEQQARFSDL